VFVTRKAAEAWFAENDPEGVALSTGFWKKQAATEQALPPALLLQQAV
jgi:hypothetical protein